MTRLTFGTAPSEDDVLDIQGESFRMNPVGMRAMRAMLRTAQGESTPEEKVQAAIDLIVASVRPDERDRLREYIEDSVGPVLLTQIAVALQKGMTDVNPTQPTSSSDGSTTSGAPSTDGVAPVELTPSI